MPVRNLGVDNMELRGVLGISSTDSLPAWMRPSIARRLNEDLSVLVKYLEIVELKRAYQTPLQRDAPGTVEEVFAVARLSLGAVSLRLHQATGRGNRNFDAEVSTAGWSFAVEVKHQRDRFPFNGPPKMTPEGLEIFEASRPGADHRYLDLAPPDTTHSLPGSNIWRAALAEALEQLPESRPGIVALSVDAFGDHEIDIESALHGDEVILGRPNPDGVGSVHTSTRIGNGIFLQPSAASLVGVFAFRLRPNEQDTELTPDWTKWYPNPRCDVDNRTEVAAFAEAIAAAV